MLPSASVRVKLSPAVRLMLPLSVLSSVGVQWLIVGAVGCPDLNAAARNRHCTVGIKPIPSRSVRTNRAAGNVHRKIIVGQQTAGSVQTVVAAGDVDIARRNVQCCGFQPFVCVGDGDGRAVGAIRADIHDQIAVQCVVPCINRDCAAFHVQKLLSVHSVIDRGVDAVRQLVSILMDNAVKYAAPDSDIALTLEKARHGVRLAVSNACEPIDEKDLSRMFDRFYRVDPSRNAATGGFGIGLSIARSIAEGHNGSIRADYKEGHIFITASLK